VTDPGPGTVWTRPRVDLVEGQPTSPVQRLLTCVDSASGVSAALDPAAWTFLNTELTVHVLREPVGEWVCMEAETTLSSGSVGVAVSKVYDERGLVARSAQALLVARI
jgi:acyl-CoA thioesterase